MENGYEKTGEFLETAMDFINFAIYRIGKKKNKFIMGFYNNGDKEHIFEITSDEDLIKRHPKVLRLAAAMTAKMIVHYQENRDFCLFWSCRNDNTFLFSVHPNPSKAQWEFATPENLSFSAQKVQWTREAKEG